VSAICGAIGTDGRPFGAADLAGVLEALAPHGRDSGGAWSGGAGRLGVAVAARLRHATPEDRSDDQPRRSPDGSLVLAGDLRLDNRPELCAALALADTPALADSEIVLAAYARFGAAALERIVGDFALAIVDRRRGGVLLARDQMGVRPLVVHERPGVVAFASNALALSAFEGVGQRLDARRAAEVLALLYETERTFVEGVRWLAPATSLWIDAAGARRRRWWHADPHAIVDLGSPGAHARELRAAFDQAVGARLRTTGAVAAATSGGLDSSSVAATAARLLAPAPLYTYTSAPPPGWRGEPRANWDADESPLVRELAALHPNIAPAFVHVEPGAGLFEGHERLWELGGGPVLNPLNWAWSWPIATRAAADGAATLLTAIRGNYLFSADAPEWLAALVRAGRGLTALREIAAMRGVAGDGRSHTLREGLVLPLLPGSARRLARAATGRPDPVQNWIAGTALRPEVAAELDLLERRPSLHVRRRPDWRAQGLRDLMSGAAGAAGTAALETLSGLEMRDPTGDRRVLEVAMRQPEWVRRRGGTTRAVARAAMADRLPPSILNRSRGGEQLPNWLDLMTAARPELIAELEELGDHATSRELIDVDRLRGLMGRWPAPTARADPAVVRDYRHLLPRALLVSRYLRWFERRAALDPVS
jgi:asparagine synthase (glutamine-hydrolysing)